MNTARRTMRRMVVILTLVAAFATAQPASASAAEPVGAGSLSKANEICKGVWRGTACSQVIEYGARWVWRMVNRGTCLREDKRYDVNPSTGYVSRTYYVCVQWS